MADVKVKDMIVDDHLQILEITTENDRKFIVELTAVE